jgi:hypothetical protein
MGTDSIRFRAQGNLGIRVSAVKPIIENLCVYRPNFVYALAFE